MNEWSWKSLEEVLTIKYGKDHKRLNDGNIPCYGTGGIMRYVDKSLSNDESILLPRKGSLNNIFYINEPFWTVDTLFWSIVDKEKALPKFLFYALSTVDLASLNVGSAVPSLTVPVLNGLKIDLPPLPEQKAIAHILGKLDDKIELNRQMNQTLEEMAQVLFKSWFVDFDPVFDNALAAGNEIPEALKAKAERRTLVPDEKKLILSNPELAERFPSTFTFNETLDKWIPEGWDVKRLEEVVEVKYGKDHKKLNEGNYPCYGSGGIMRYVDETLYNSESVLIPRKGTLSNLMYIREPFWSVDTMFYSIMLRHNFVKYFFHLMQRYNLAEMNVGSAVPSMTTKLLNSLNLIIPDQLVLKEFDEEVETIFSRVDLSNSQTQTLTQLRDTLLPQLISGKVRVPEEAINKTLANHQ